MNRVEIVVTGQNQSGPTIDTAKSQVAGLTESVKQSGPVLESSKRQATGFGDSVKRVGEIAQAIIAAEMFQQIGQSAQKFLGDAKTAASNLEQALGGTKAVFGDASAAVDEFAATAAQTAGLSEAQFRDMSTLIGGQFKRMTGDIRFASDASIQLTQVAADLAATYGGTTKEAMDAFAAALRGEADPAERFNLDLKLSVVQAKAVEMGLAATTSQVDDNARAQATLALILQQSGDAQGQFAREADTAAVAQQKMAAQAENARAALGEALLPAVSLLSNALTNVLQAFQDLPSPARAVVGSLVLLGAGVVTVTSRVAPMIVAMQGAGISMASMSARARAATLALGPLAIAVGLASAGWVIYANRQRAAADRVQELSEHIDRQTGKLDEQGRVLRADRLARDRYVQQLLAEGLAAEDLIGAIDGDADAIARVNQFKADAGIMSAAHTDRIIREEQAALAAAAAQDDLKRALGGATGATGEATEAQKLAAAQAQETAKAVEDLKKAWQDAADGFVDAVEAYTDAGEDLRDDQKLTADMVLEQLRRQVEAQDRWHENMISLARRVPPAIFDELARLGPEGAEMVALLNSMTDAELAEWVANMGRRGRDAGGNLISEVQHNFVAGAPVLAAIAEQKGQQVADQIAAGMRARGTTVEQEARRIGLAIDRGVGGNRRIIITPVIAPTQGHMPGQFNAHGGIVGGLASGGISGARAQAGGPRGADVLVGEQGPEIAELPFGTRVIPSGQSQAIMSAEERAAQELLSHIRGGGEFFEDFSFSGMSSNLRRFNDTFARRFGATGQQFSRSAMERFLSPIAGRSEADQLMRTIKDAGPRGSALYDVFRESDMSMRRARELFDIWMESAERSNRLTRFDEAALARALRSALQGVSVRLDGRVVGQIEARQADLLRRGG